MKVLNLSGVVIDDDETFMYDWLGQNYISPSLVQNFLNSANGEDIQVLINSGGGSVFAGSEIYTALKSYDANVEVVVTGLAASIASVIAMAGDTIKVSPLGQFMIHNAAMVASGDHNVHADTAEHLVMTSESIANVYATKTGLEVNELLQMMEDESWMTAEESVKLGFADEVLFNDTNSFKLSASIAKPIDKEKALEFKRKLLDEQESIDDKLTEKITDIVTQVLSEKTLKSEQTVEEPTVNALAKYIF